MADNTILRIDKIKVVNENNGQQDIIASDIPLAVLSDKVLFSGERNLNEVLFGNNELTTPSILDEIKSVKNEEYTLPIASASTLGGIKIGSGLSINNATGVLSVDQTETEIGYIAGDGIQITTDNTISLIPATATTLGGVKIGAGLTYSSNGTINAILPAATSHTLGGIKVGSGLNITQEGMLSVDSLSITEVPAATADTLGGIKISYNNGVLTIATE